MKKKNGLDDVEKRLFGGLVIIGLFMCGVYFYMAGWWDFLGIPEKPYYYETGELQKVDSYTIRGQQGDFIGGFLNPIISFFSIMVVTWAIRLQYKEMTDMNKAMTQQLRVMDQQKFDSAFFQMYQAWREIREGEVAKIVNRDLIPRNAIQRSAVFLVSFYDYLERKVSMEPDHYYNAMIKASMSDVELKALFEHTFYANPERPELQRLGEKYGIFDRLPEQDKCDFTTDEYYTHMSDQLQRGRITNDEWAIFNDKFDAAQRRPVLTAPSPPDKG